MINSSTKRRRCSWSYLLVIAFCSCADARTVRVEDAYVRSAADNQTWTIGTKAVQMVFELKDGQVRAISYQNKLSSSPREYLSAKSPSALFALETRSSTNSFAVERVSAKFLPRSPANAAANWALEQGLARPVAAGGRPAIQLDLVLRQQSLRAQVHFLAYPRMPVLRYWMELENTGPNSIVFDSPALLSLDLRRDDITAFTNYWMIGGNNATNQGLLKSAPVAPGYHSQLMGQMANNFTPWMGMLRGSRPKDGWFVALEYLGSWRLALDCNGPEAASAKAAVPGLAALPAGQRLQLPLITLGVFKGDLEDMAKRLYNWQYEYLWDYTSDDYYALMQWDSAWYNEARNLQENFAGRLGQLDMDFPDMMRSVGMEVLWDDAGWSENPNIWSPSREGPDFAQTQRYLAKMGMKWALWFCGRPTVGLMDSKVGSWGNFQWRTDGVGSFDLSSDRAYREQIGRFRKIHPRSSFHTCNGGGTYAHAFEMQRLADINMFSDPGGGDQTNYYFSFLDTPDKWMDLMPSFNTRGAYTPETARQILSMVPCWDLYCNAEEQEQLRRIAEIYHYLLCEGVAGRWTYASHPVVVGDAEYYYFQRISSDHKKSCIILKHRPASPTRIYPRELLPDHPYVLGFDSTQATTTRTGRDLMANGITLKNQAPGELVYLGLPNRPGSGRDRTAPTRPGRVLTRRETNIGHSGVGVYWSPGADNNWVSYYEVRRDTKILGKASIGTYYFDHASGWDPRASYSVRTVDGDENRSDWVMAMPLADEPLVASALGGHFADSGREGWRAETMTDGHSFVPMTWVPAAKSPAGDANGTPNQPGGAEGYWEGAETARIGRGWQQASSKGACVRTWIAPETGTVRVVGRAAKEYYRRDQGAPMRVRILRGETRIWPKEDWAIVPVGSLLGCTHDLTVNIVSGDAIRFVLDRGSNPESDIIAWMPRISYAREEQSSNPASVVRILCGAKRTAFHGNAWSQDKFYTGGRPRATDMPAEPVWDGSRDSASLQTAREGKDFVYAIPVAPGLYSLRLKFVEPKFNWSFERPFNLSINGRPVLHNFDICQAAGGPRQSHERVFRYLVPDAEGRLVLRFTGGREPLQRSDQAIIEAIEVLPELKPTIRINVGSDQEFVDWNSFVWSSDSGFLGGQIIHSASSVSQASPTLYDQALYQSARAGRTFSYSISVPPGLYTVHLKFAELWLAETGQRPMNIEINGRPMWKSWDPATAAGQIGMAADIRAEDIAPSDEGLISIRLSAAASNDAILQGIEIE